MKKNIYKYAAFIGILTLASCEPEFDDPLEDSPITEERGEADFSKYVAVGASITAGFGDGSLYIEGQEVGFPNIIATQMQAAGGGEFTIPFMADNIGGFAGIFEVDDEGAPTDEPTFATRLIIDAATESPVRANDNVSVNDPGALISGLYNNIGIPGAKSFNAITNGYGAFNPYFGRMATSADASMISDAVAQEPTFFSLWLGGNDVLSYATSGGTGVDQFTAANDDDTTYGPDDITSLGAFDDALDESLDALTANGASGVIFNVPTLSDLPFFTTVPNNALVLDTEQAANLTGFFQAYSGIFAGGVTLQLIEAGLDAATASAQANALAAQYAITFNEGPNRFLIATEPSQINPQGFRQMTEDELLLLSIDTAALSEQGYGSVVVTDEVEVVLGKLRMQLDITPEEGLLVLNAINPIADEDALDITEINAINTATNAYNESIADAANNNSNLMLFDANGLVSELRTDGLQFDGGSLFPVLGSAFSLDGIHLSPRGNAVFANRVMEEMNAFFGSTLQPVNPLNFKTITLKEFEFSAQTDIDM